jgi:hypothetical protein
MSDNPQDQPKRPQREADPSPPPAPEPTIPAQPKRRQGRVPRLARRPTTAPPDESPAEAPAEALPAAEPLPQYEPFAPAAPRRSPEQSGLYFPWWSVVGLVAIVGLLSCVIWGLIYTGGGSEPGGRTPEIIITTATAPPVTQTIPPTPLTPTLTPTPGPTEAPTLPPSNIAMEVGVTVEIVGTEGAGLSIRDSAGTNYARVDTAYDGEIFIVEDGPLFGDGYEWWFIADPNDPERAGWSVRQFMQVIAPAEASGE